jgi:hypothetical protein
MKLRALRYAGRGLAACALIAVPWAAWATSAEIRAYGGEGPLGGCTTCYHSADQWNQNAKAGDSVGYSLGDTAADGSYADANGSAAFGQLHAYADAHRTFNNQLGGPIIVGDAQASTTTSFIDYLLPSANNPAIGYAGYMLTLALSGSHTLVDTAYPNAITAMAQVSWDLSDNSTGMVYANGIFDTTDATPSTTLHIPVPQALVKPGDLMRVEVGLSTFAYVMSNNAPQYLTAVADYHDTLIAHLDAVTPGANTVGISGFDYATAAAVPEPASAWLLLGGCGLLGLGRLRARS